MEYRLENIKNLNNMFFVNIYQFIKKFLPNYTNTSGKFQLTCLFVLMVITGAVTLIDCGNHTGKRMLFRMVLGCSCIFFGIINFLKYR